VSQKKIIETAETIDNRNSQQSLINIAFLIRKNEGLAINELETFRKKNQSFLKDKIYETNTALVDKLPSYDELVNFIETYGYKMGNPLSIYLNFRLKRGNQIDFRKFMRVNDGKISNSIQSIKQMNNYIGEENLSYISIKCGFVGFEALEGDYLDQIKDLQYMFDGKKGYKSITEEEIFSKFLNTFPEFEYQGNTYWLYGAYKKDIVSGKYYLITKIGGKIKVVGGCKITLYPTKYRMEEIFILPKFRRNGYSLVLNKFIQEKTGLNYDTGGDRTQLGFYQMLRNKRVLKYESFINKMY
jgi:hypothetical protein